MPDQYSTLLQHPCKFTNDTNIVTRMGKEAERSEEIDDRVEATRPPRRHFSHVTPSVAERAAFAAAPSNRQQISRVVEAVHIVARFGEQMRMATLPARHVENPPTHRQPQQIKEPRRFVAIALGRKERAVLQEIVGVEGGLPPLAFLSQKNTGSR